MKKSQPIFIHIQWHVIVVALLLRSMFAHTCLYFVYNVNTRFHLYTNYKRCSNIEFRSALLGLVLSTSSFNVRRNSSNKRCGCMHTFMLHVSFLAYRFLFSLSAARCSNMHICTSWQFSEATTALSNQCFFSSVNCFCFACLRSFPLFEVSWKVITRSAFSNTPAVQH